MSYASALRSPRPLPLASLGLLLVAAIALSLAGQPPAPGGPAAPAEQSLSFVPNRGQTDAAVHYYARTPNFGAYFTRDGLTLDLHKGTRAAALELRFPGANRSVTPEASARAPGRVSYLMGDRHYANLPSYSEVRYPSLWPGIDLLFRGQGGQLKYEFLVRPGADVSNIRLTYAGADSLALEHGALAVRTHAGTLRDAAPLTRQGSRTVASRYSLAGDTYGFVLGAYDHRRPLVIDPGLDYSTFLGGGDPDVAAKVAADSNGNAYVVGETLSAGFPTTPGAYDTTVGGPWDAFVTKLNPSGQLVYSTYLGGSGGDHGGGIAVDGEGHAFVGGHTSSSDFPTTPGTDHSLDGPSDAFVTKFNAAGTDLLYSTYLGGSGSENVLHGFTIDASGHAYVAGQTISADFPDTSGGAQPAPSFPGALDGFIAKLGETGRSIDWATYLGGRFDEAPWDIAVDGLGNAYVTGQTSSSDFPLTPGAYDSTHGAYEDGFVTKINAAGGAFDYSTLIGGDGIDSPKGIAVDGGGNAYVTGNAGADWPTTPGAFDRGLAGYPDAFITKMNPSGGGLVYSTFLGSRGGGQGTDPVDIALDGSNQAFVAGSTGRDVPTTPGAYDNTRTGVDAIVMGVNSDASALVYGTYLGGSSYDFASGIALAGNRAIVAGSTGSSDFPVTPGAPQTTHGGGSDDAFVARLGLFQGYPRPRGATPLRLPLVIAYKFRQCSSSQELQHGPPLAYSSCPPRVESTQLTTGTPDSNGLFVRMEAYLLFKAIVGNPSTPADEADVKVTLHVNDVLTTSLEPYTGELRARVLARLTDRDAGIMQTTSDFPFGLTAPCVPDADPRLGSACDAVTTMDALVPGSAPESNRSVWQFAQAHVFDAGPDGDVLTEADNTVYLRQGIFIP